MNDKDRKNYVDNFYKEALSGFRFPFYAQQGGQMTNELTLYTRHKSLVDSDFESLVTMRQELSAQKKEIETEMKGINEEISGLMAGIESKAVLCDGWKVTLSESIRKTLKRERLLSAGVTVEQIESATIETVVTRLTVNEIKE